MRRLRWGVIAAMVLFVLSVGEVVGGGSNGLLLAVLLSVWAVLALVAQWGFERRH